MHDVGRAVRRAISQEMGVGDHGVATRWVARQVISKKRHERLYPAVGTTPAGRSMVPLTAPPRPP